MDDEKIDRREKSKRKIIDEREHLNKMNSGKSGEKSLKVNI